MRKEIEDDTNKRKDILCSWTGRINIIKMYKAIYRFNTISIKTPMTLFIELEQRILKFVWKHKRTAIIKAILKKKIGQSWRCHPPRLQMILQSCSNQNTMVPAQNIYKDQWKKIGSPEIKPCMKMRVLLAQSYWLFVIP